MSKQFTISIRHSASGYRAKVDAGITRTKAGHKVFQVTIQTVVGYVKFNTNRVREVINLLGAFPSTSATLTVGHNSVRLLNPSDVIEELESLMTVSNQKIPLEVYKDVAQGFVEEHWTELLTTCILEGYNLMQGVGTFFNKRNMVRRGQESLKFQEAICVELQRMVDSMKARAAMRSDTVSAPPEGPKL